MAEIRQPRVSGGELPCPTSDLKGWDRSPAWAHPRAHMEAYESELGPQPRPAVMCPFSPPRGSRGALRSWGMGSHGTEKPASLDSGGLSPLPRSAPSVSARWAPCPHPGLPPDPPRGITPTS